MGEQSGRERKQFWLSDPLRRPERTAEKREREREREREGVWYFGYCRVFAVFVVHVVASVW